MKYFAAFIALACACSPAIAEVSDDLKFCGSLKDRAERLSCYDAAARIASRPSPVIRTAARVSTPSLEAQAAMPAKAIIEAPPLRNRFDGYYAAIGGGYGLISGRSAFNGIGPFDSAQGPFVTAVAGRNLGFNWGIVGIEVDGRWLGETASRSNTIFPGILDSGSGVSSYRYENDIAAHASLRVGVVYGDSMIFAKAGLGAVRATERFRADTTGILFCDPAKFPIFGFSCSPTRFGGLTTERIETWAPSVILGLGVEQNWGSLFGRLGVDVEASNHRTTTASNPTTFFGSNVDQLTWATRGTAMIGYRF